MSVSNLTNTAWYFNEHVNVEPISDYWISFTSNNTSFISIEGEYNSTSPSFLKYYGTAELTYVYSYNDDADVPWTEGRWNAEGYRTIEITGGNDVTNADLISWLENSATQIIYQRNEYVTNTQELTSIADIIRAKLGAITPLSYPTDFISAINLITTQDVKPGARTVVLPSGQPQIITPVDADAFSYVNINITTPFYSGGILSE